MWSFFIKITGKRIYCFFCSYIVLDSTVFSNPCFASIYVLVLLGLWNMAVIVVYNSSSFPLIQKQSISINSFLWNWQAHTLCDALLTRCLLNCCNLLNEKNSLKQGYAPTNSDRREGVLRRKRLEYLDCVAQYYDIPDIDRTDEEITMLRQVVRILTERHSNYHLP